jgi:hypothetical protein
MPPMPSCCQVRKTCLHILFLNHGGQVEALRQSVVHLEQWLFKVDTDSNLQECIVDNV